MGKDQCENMGDAPSLTSQGRPAQPQDTVSFLPGVERRLVEGVTYSTWFPFKRDTWTEFGPEGSTDHPTWVPGWNAEFCGSDGGHVEYDWDGDGALLIQIVSLHKPAHYAERAFYVRQWRDPDGRVFGKRQLRMISASAVLNWLLGSKTHHLGLTDPEWADRLSDGTGGDPSPTGSEAQRSTGTCQASSESPTQ